MKSMHEFFFFKNEEHHNEYSVSICVVVHCIGTMHWGAIDNTDSTVHRAGVLPRVVASPSSYHVLYISLHFIV